VPPPIKPEKSGGLQKPEDALLRAQKQKDGIADECAALETELEELRVQYEMYFLGVEKREPNRVREELKKRVLRIKEAFTRNAALRFRLQSLHARFLSYERMWLRSSREKEEGTYHRDVFKAKLHAAARERKERAAAEEAGVAPPPVAQKAPGKTPGAPKPQPAPDLLAAWGVKPGVAAAPRGPAPAAPPNRPPVDAAERQMRELYTQYVSAKKQCGEDVSRLTYDAVAKSVQKQVPEIMTRYNAKSVEFKVVVKDGKATLKAVPKV
jgi:hypothetical protein